MASGQSCDPAHRQMGFELVNLRVGGGSACRDPDRHHPRQTDKLKHWLNLFT
jgi:hypothetical protein